jgi:hypothetical protein
MNNDPEQNETLIDALRSYGLREDIKKLHNEIMPGMQKAQVKTTPVLRLSRLISRVAAAILLLVLGTGIFLYIDTTAESLYSKKYIPYEASPQRGGSEPSNTRAIKEFENAQYLLQTNQPGRAIHSLEKILENNISSGKRTLNDDVEYYLALAFLKDRQAEKAYELFTKIHNDPHHLYHDQVSDWDLLRLKILSWKNKQ